MSFFFDSTDKCLLYFNIRIGPRGEVYGRSLSFGFWLLALMFLFFFLALVRESGIQATGMESY